MRLDGFRFMDDTPSVNGEWSPGTTRDGGCAMRLNTESGEFIPVADLRAASREFRAWIVENGYGASDLHPSSGNVLDENGKFVAHVSYNGRLWNRDGSEMVVAS